MWLTGVFLQEWSSTAWRDCITELVELNNLVFSLELLTENNKRSKAHIPICVRTDLCWRLVLFSPVLLSVFWQDLPKETNEQTKKSQHRSSMTLIMMNIMIRHLFKLFLDVCICLQFELSASVRPIHEEEPLLGVHLLDQYGCFLVVPHLKMKWIQVVIKGPSTGFISTSSSNSHLWFWKSFARSRSLQDIKYDLLWFVEVEKQKITSFHLLYFYKGSFVSGGGVFVSLNDNKH